MDSFITQKQTKLNKNCAPLPDQNNATSAGSLWVSGVFLESTNPRWGPKCHVLLGS